MSVGTIEERKNLLLAVKAIERLGDVHLCWRNEYVYYDAEG